MEIVPGQAVHLSKGHIFFVVSPPQFYFYLPTVITWQSFFPSDHLRADRPLLALMERPGSGRDLVMEGILTEPLNTVRLS